MVPASIELTKNSGGNDAAIVCKSADVKTLAPKVAELGFLNSGQVSPHSVIVATTDIFRFVLHSREFSFTRTFMTSLEML